MADINLKDDFIKHVQSTESAADYDVTVLVGEKFDEQHFPSFVHSSLQAVKKLKECDLSEDICVCAEVAVGEAIPMLILGSPTGPLNRDYDDSRRYREAAARGIKRALKAGKKKPLLVVSDSHRADPEYKEGLMVAIMGALEAVYVPIEVREAVPDKSTKVSVIGLASNELDSDEKASKLIKSALGLEFGRIIARDIGGSDPERMAPAKVEDYLRSVFNGTSIQLSVVAGHQAFVKDYPLFAAVDRCADVVHHHQGRIIYLEYNGDGDATETHMFVGKGVTYDTGGNDVKAGGHMAGMHRDKCGAATVAGLFGILEKLRPPNVKVVGRLAMVRNSIGAHGYVADEIITSAAGVRVRVGNTDAEGRMAMTDPLHHSRLQALNETNPHLYTVATLTGHAVIAVGEPYTVVLDNGPAGREKFAQNLQSIGHPLSDPFEVSTLRREDYEFIAGRNEYEDVLQCNNEASSATCRGHQFPAAFMVRASGLDKHGVNGDRPLKYTHIDIAGSSGSYPGIPTAAPLIALSRWLKAF